MRRGYRVLIVAVVAIGTTMGLHAAFGRCGKGYWGHHGNWRHGNNNECNYQSQGCGGHYNGCADPWNCAPKNNSVEGAKDTVPK